MVTPKSNFLCCRALWPTFGRFVSFYTSRVDFRAFNNLIFDGYVLMAKA
jgi:hypothetical protein